MDISVFIPTAGVREHIGAALARHGLRAAFCDSIDEAAHTCGQRACPAVLVEMPPELRDAAAAAELWPNVDPANTLRIAVMPGAGGRAVEAAARAGADEIITQLDDDLDARMVLLARRVRRCTQCRHVRRQRRMQEKLAHLAAIVENSDDAIIGETLDGTVTSWNAGAEKIFGYTAEEAIGRSISMIVPPERGEELEKILDQLRGGGHVDHFETVRMRKDGRRIQVSLSVSPLHDEDDVITGASVIGRDITERKHLEAQILHATDDERRRIGRDLHDGLGSHLTGVSLTCRALSRRYAKGKPIRQEELDGIAGMVQEAAQQARLLARGLDPVKVTDRGLATALEELAATTRRVSGVKCVFAAEKGLPDLTPGAATHLYRIAQEAVNNALKHAGAGSIRIRLHRPNSSLILQVRDDGVGLTDTEDSSRGMGLHVMRYRADVIGAAFSLRNHPDGGARVTIKLPLDEAEAVRQLSTPDLNVAQTDE